MEEELMNLFIIYSKEIIVIDNIENGHYTEGIRSFNIPKNDKPKQLNKQKVQKLF